MFRSHTLLAALKTDQTATESFVAANLRFTPPPPKFYEKGISLICTGELFFEECLETTSMKTFEVGLVFCPSNQENEHLFSSFRDKNILYTFTSDNAQLDKPTAPAAASATPSTKRGRMRSKSLAPRLSRQQAKAFFDLHVSTASLTSIAEGNEEDYILGNAGQNRQRSQTEGAAAVSFNLLKPNYEDQT